MSERECVQTFERRTPVSFEPVTFLARRAWKEYGSSMNRSRSPRDSCSLAGVIFGVGMAVGGVNFMSWLFP